MQVRVDGTERGGIVTGDDQGLQAVTLFDREQAVLQPVHQRPQFVAFPLRDGEPFNHGLALLFAARSRHSNKSRRIREIRMYKAVGVVCNSSAIAFIDSSPA